jgi:hypothetical protein
MHSEDEGVARYSPPRAPRSRGPGSVGGLPARLCLVPAPRVPDGLTVTRFL